MRKILFALATILAVSCTVLSATSCGKTKNAPAPAAVSDEPKKETVDGQLPTPDVPDDQLLETILAPHRGKVVLIDIWNTWCPPCRAAIRANEPLKDTELSSPDIVWIYLADESSPVADYAAQIPHIRGLHYRLPTERWESLILNHFPELDGIPAYVLVKRDGSYQLRLDFRDHEIMKSELQKALAE